MLKLKLTYTEMGLLILALGASQMIFRRGQAPATPLDELLVEHIAELEYKLTGRINGHQLKYSLKMTSLESKAFTLWFMRHPIADVDSLCAATNSYPQYIAAHAVVSQILAAIDRLAKNPKPKHP